MYILEDAPFHLASTPGSVTPRERRLAALWFVDLVGYSELIARDEGQAMAAVDTLQELARRVVPERGGRVVKFMGDAVLAEFPSADGAVRSAIDLRDGFSSEMAGRGLAHSDLRAGVHIGEIVAAPDGDVYGDGVNVAARIQTAADPGEVWVSEDVWRLLRQVTELRFEPRGERVLKGVSTLVDTWAVHLEGSGPPTKARPTPKRQSVAVLPFANLSPGSESEYFSDGVTEEILSTLARIEGLKVISRTSVMRYRKTDKPIRLIGQELGVGSILQGSVRQAGGRVRITAQLIDATTDEHLWSERYDRELEDIFEIQSDVAERIVEALRVRLEPRERARLAERPTDDVEAYQSYLRGRHFLNRRTESNLRQAIEWFSAALDRDSSSAPAWSSLAEAWSLLPHYSIDPVPEADSETRSAAARALAIDPGRGEAHAALGSMAWTVWRWDEAEAEFRRAVEIDSGYATAHLWYGNFLSLRGRGDEAFAEHTRALELDPVSLPAHMGYGAALHQHRRFEEAIEVYRKAIALDPGYVPAHNNLINPYLCLGRFDDALDEMETASRLDHDGMPRDFVREVRAGYETGGERGFWEAVLEGLRSRPHSRGRDYFMLQACARLGRIDEAFALIDRLLEARRPSALQVAFDPLLDPLRPDPRWVTVLERLEIDPQTA